VPGCWSIRPAWILAGSELDYTDELMGSHFAVRNPNAKSACGCGTSFSVD